MPLDRELNKGRKHAKISRADRDGRSRRNDFHAIVRESVSLTPLPGPSGVAEATEATDRNSEVVLNFPASTQDSIVLEPLQGEMSDNFQSDAAESSSVALTAREMRRAELTDEVREEKAAAREAKARKARLASLQVPPYYCVGGEGVEPNRGRKRTFEGRNEPSSRSSSSDDSSRSSDSRANQPSRATIIGLGDGGESVGLTAEGELAVSSTVGERRWSCTRATSQPLSRAWKR
jgi:hypothetical protein